MKFPNAMAAIDEFLAKMVKEHADEFVEYVVAAAMVEPEEPPKVEFKQTEVVKDG